MATISVEMMPRKEETLRTVEDYAGEAARQERPRRVKIVLNLLYGTGSGNGGENKERRTLTLGGGATESIDSESEREGECL